jgi:hypothetical protein
VSPQLIWSVRHIVSSRVSDGPDQLWVNHVDDQACRGLAWGTPGGEVPSSLAVLEPYTGKALAGGAGQGGGVGAGGPGRVGRARRGPSDVREESKSPAPPPRTDHRDPKDVVVAQDQVDDPVPGVAPVHGTQRSAPVPGLVARRQGQDAAA